MIERHITFSVQPDHGDAFERFFADQYRPAASKSPGYVRLELIRAAADPASYEMSFRWADAEAAAGWRTASVHEALQPALKRLSAMGEIRIFDVVV